MSRWLNKIPAYLRFLVPTFIVWALVPAFAKLGDLDGLQKTFWINLVAVPVLLVIMWATKKLGRKHYPVPTKADVFQIALLGLVYPLAYSVFYFQAIYEGSPSLTTIIGRTSILIYAPLSVFVFKRGKLAKADVALMFISVTAVAVAMSNSVIHESVTLTSIGLAALASVTFGIYTAVGEDWQNKYDPMVVTLITVVVTTMGSGIAVLFTHRLVPPTGNTFWFLLYLGGIANGFAFWWFLEGLQEASGAGVNHKVVYLVLLSGFLTFAQMAVVAWSGAEHLNPWMWAGSVILVIGLAWYTYIKQSQPGSKRAGS